MGICRMRRWASYLGITLLSGLAGLPTPARADIASAYYNTAGDNQFMTIFQPGGVVAQVPIQLLGYPIAVRNTVWVGDRDDNGAIEYTLAGVPTGNTASGGGNFTQLLDGTTDGVAFNYGVECCGGTNSVTRANLDWSGQVVLFDLPVGTDGIGITYDTTDNTLWVSDFGGTVVHYDLLGNALGSFVSPVGNLAGLAYEQASDTLWGKNNGGNQLFQLSKAGVLLDTLSYAVSTGNDWGGEFAITPIPEPGSLALLGLGLTGTLVAARRRRMRAVA